MWVSSREHKYVELFPFALEAITSHSLRSWRKILNRPLQASAPGLLQGANEFVYTCSLEDSRVDRLPGCKSLKNNFVNSLNILYWAFFFFWFPGRCVLCQEWPVILARSCLPPSGSFKRATNYSLNCTCSFSAGTLWSTSNLTLAVRGGYCPRRDWYTGSMCGWVLEFSSPPLKCFDAKNSGYSARAGNEALIRITKGLKPAVAKKAGTEGSIKWLPVEASHRAERQAEELPEAQGVRSAHPGLCSGVSSS